MITVVKHTDTQTHTHTHTNTHTELVSGNVNLGFQSLDPKFAFQTLSKVG